MSKGSYRGASPLSGDEIVMRARGGHFVFPTEEGIGRALTGGGDRVGAIFTDRRALQGTSALCRED